MAALQRETISRISGRAQIAASDSPIVSFSGVSGHLSGGTAETAPCRPGPSDPLLLRLRSGAHPPATRR